MQLFRFLWVLPLLLWPCLSAFGAPNFKDLPVNYWASKYITYLADQEVSGGYPDGSFRPEQAVTRAEFAAMLAKSQGLNSPVPSTFSDVPSGHWAAPAIAAVAAQGWIAGYPGNRFLPNQSISQTEMYAIIYKASGQSGLNNSDAEVVLGTYADANRVPAWAKVAVATLLKEGFKANEESPSLIAPQARASRAVVAAALAKLLNPAFRGAKANLGPAVNVAGKLKPTAKVGEWLLEGDDAKEYTLTNLGDFSKQAWFKVGQRVQVQGSLNADTSTATKPAIKVQNITNLGQSSENAVKVFGTLQPSTQISGDWLLKTTDGATYHILNPEKFNTASWFRYGAAVSANGNLRPDIQSAEGTSLLADKIEPSAQQKTISVSGNIRPTAQSGGWYLEGENFKYVLMDIEAATSSNWFKSGAKADVEGVVRNDIPSVYTEGPVLVVSKISPNANDIEGAQTVSLYFPNLLNVVSNPGTLLGNPIDRTIEGPEIPRKSVEALLSGPTAAEQIKGYFLDKDLRQITLESLNISGGTANVKLKAPTGFTFKNANLPKQLSEAVKKTLAQFEGVQTVNLSLTTADNQSLSLN